MGNGLRGNHLKGQRATSSRLIPYLVSADEINRIYGSNDAELLQGITGNFAGRIRSLSEWVTEYYEDTQDEEADEHEERLTMEQAVAQIIDGNLTTDHF